MNRSILYDGALDAYSELVLWRLRGVRAMVSLVDHETQYFVAGVTREDIASDEISANHDWFGCTTVATPGGLCENVLAVKDEKDDYPCFVIADLAGDSRFADLSVIDGTLASYRFYAGTPITTSHGINIGSFFIFDNQPRPEGLTLRERKCLFETAANIMKHLESKREAVERRRVSLMSSGVAKFLERATRLTRLEFDSSNSLNTETTKVSSMEDTAPIGVGATGVTTMITQSLPVSTNEDDWQGKERASEIVLDKIKTTLDHAAEILRESLELTAGGVVFLDTAIGYAEPKTKSEYFDRRSDLGTISEKTGSDELESSATMESEDLTMTGIDPRTAISPGQVRGYHDEFRPAKVLAVSASKNAYRKSNNLDGMSLQNFIDVYPKGNVWYINEQGYFSSLDQIEEIYSQPGEANMYEKRASIDTSGVDITRQVSEAALLAKVFHNARQIMFIPLWDARGNRWHSGCFVWSNYAFPVFTMDSELSYLSALTNSVMVEISRLDSITTNNMKSDFISSISHEFRSPLHGILASAEFLHDSHLDSTQMELVSTIQTCGWTLLDTINHVLDYSKINSFEKKGRTGALSNELDNISNVALLCEDIVNGIMAAREFSSLGDSNGRSSEEDARPAYDNPVEIILDFENRDWNFKVQPGAIRRIIMNIFGNAQKYTESGFILVQLRVRETPQQTNFNLNPGQKMLAMNIIDSGTGMSQQYMERKLYIPFAQEDSFTPGLGLGLSIVRSIVNQLCGKINIRSELGKGTDVEVLLPLLPLEVLDATDATEVPPTSPGHHMHNAQRGDYGLAKCLEELRQVARGKTIAIWRKEPSVADHNKDLAWKTVAAYCKTWFGFTLLPGQDLERLSKVDMVIKEWTDTDGDGVGPSIAEASRVLILQERLCRQAARRSRQETKASETISMPVGPFKLARSILALFRNKERKATIGEEEVAPRVLFDRVQSDDTVMQEPNHGLVGGGPQPESDERTNEEKPADPTTLNGMIEYAMSFDSVDSLGAAQTRPQSAMSEFRSLRPDPKTQNSLQVLETFSSLSLMGNTGESRPLYVLAVDDNSLNLLLLTRYLNKRNMDSVVTARNGVEAVTAVKRAAEDDAGQPTGRPFDVIFMDISMPAMDGFEATRLIRKFEREQRAKMLAEALIIPESVSPIILEPEAVTDGVASMTNGAAARSMDDVNVFEQDHIISRKLERVANIDDRSAYIVALTGLASRRDRDKAVASGFDDFLTKPISFGMIGELLEQLSGRPAEETKSR